MIGHKYPPCHNIIILLTQKSKSDQPLVFWKNFNCARLKSTNHCGLFSHPHPGWESRFFIGVASNGDPFPIQGFSDIRLLATERMKLLMSIAPLIFTEASTKKYMDTIQTVFEMVEDPVANIAALNATVVDRPLCLALSEIWKWRVDFIIGKMPPVFADFVDLPAAATHPKYPGMQIVGFAYDTWIRGGIVPINRARARACDILSGPSTRKQQPGTSTKKANQLKAKEEQRVASDKRKAAIALCEYWPLVSTCLP